MCSQNLPSDSLNSCEYDNSNNKTTQTNNPRTPQGFARPQRWVLQITDMPLHFPCLVFREGWDGKKWLISFLFYCLFDIVLIRKEKLLAPGTISFIPLLSVNIFRAEFSHLPAQIALTHWKEKKIAILVEILLTWKLFFMDIEKKSLHLCSKLQSCKDFQLGALESSQATASVCQVSPWRIQIFPFLKKRAKLWASSSHRTSGKCGMVAMGCETSGIGFGDDFSQIYPKPGEACHGWHFYSCTGNTRSGRICFILCECWHIPRVIFEPGRWMNPGFPPQPVLISPCSEHHCCGAPQAPADVSTLGKEFKLHPCNF